MKFVISVCFFLLLSACQTGSLSNWFNQGKEDALTYLASQVVDNSLSEETKEDLLYLFVDLKEAKSCSKLQSYIEDNNTLRFFEKHLDLPNGFLFDELLNYDYEAALTKTDRSEVENVVFSVLSVWKTEASTEEIKELITKVVKCYPDEYL